MRGFDKRIMPQKNKTAYDVNVISYHIQNRKAVAIH